jgi:hypothetical protein
MGGVTELGVLKERLTQPILLETGMLQTTQADSPFGARPSAISLLPLLRAKMAE